MVWVWEKEFKKEWLSQMDLKWVDKAKLMRTDGSTRDWRKGPDGWGMECTVQEWESKNVAVCPRSARGGPGLSHEESTIALTLAWVL